MSPQKLAAGQSPQEQDSEVSQQGTTDTLRGSMREELSAADVKLIANGEPGSNSSAFLPMNLNHAATQKMLIGSTLPS